MSGRWVARYEHGERAAIWQELAALGEDVRAPRHAGGAYAVCEAMARRARFNVETLVRRLSAQGFRFQTNDGAASPIVPFHPATPAAPEVVAWLTDHVGPVPMTLEAWLREVGDVWLVGTHPAWPESREADGLVIQAEGSHFPGFAITESFLAEHQAWREWGAASGDPFVLPVAPDRLTKADISGGAPYGFVLPSAAVDGTFDAGAGQPFITYLNAVFRSGGFPAAVPDRDRMPILASLAEGLLEL